MFRAALHLLPLRLTLLITALSAILLGSACSLDPAGDDARAYVAAMNPVLADNMALAEDMLSLAAGIKKRDLDEEDLLRRWKAEVLPLAQGLHDKAKAVTPQDPGLAQAHAQLVSAWKDRADAFQSAFKNADKGDLQPFDEALKLRAQAQKAEQEGLKAINSSLEPHGLTLDLYPARAAAPASPSP